MLKVITEWHSPNFHTSEGLLVFLCLLLPLLILLTSKKDISVYDGFIFIGFTLLTLRMIRMTPLFLIAVTPLVFRYSDFLAHDFSRMFTKAIHGILSLFAVFLVASALVKIPLIVESPVSTDSFPAEALPTLLELKPQRMLNDYNWGGYLIFNLYDYDIPVFIDGRADVYSPYTLEDYTHLIWLDEGYESLLSKYSFDYAALPKSSLLGRQLRDQHNWDVIYQDNLTIILRNPHAEMSK